MSNKVTFDLVDEAKHEVTDIVPYNNINMNTSKDAGLASIARSAKASDTKQPGRVPAPTSAEEKPILTLEGRHQKTSLSLDVGLWSCLLETAYTLTKRLRAMGRGRVTLSKVIEIAFIAFHKLPIEQQVELIRKHE